MDKTNRTTTLLRLKASSNMTVAILLVLVLAVAVSLLSNRHYDLKDKWLGFEVWVKR